MAAVPARRRRPHRLAAGGPAGRRLGRPVCPAASGGTGGWGHPQSPGPAGSCSGPQSPAGRLKGVRSTRWLRRPTLPLGGDGSRPGTFRWTQAASTRAPPHSSLACLIFCNGSAQLAPPQCGPPSPNHKQNTRLRAGYARDQKLRLLQALKLALQHLLLRQAQSPAAGAPCLLLRPAVRGLR